MLLTELSNKTGHTIADLDKVCRMFGLKIEGSGATQKLSNDSLNALMTLLNNHKEKGQDKPLIEYAQDVLKHFNAAASAKEQEPTLPNLSKVFQDLANRKGSETLSGERLKDIHAQAKTEADETAVMTEILRQYYLTLDSVVNGKAVQAIRQAAQAARAKGFFDESQLCESVGQLLGEIESPSANFTNALIQGTAENQGSTFPRPQQQTNSRLLSGGNTK